MTVFQTCIVFDGIDSFEEYWSDILVECISVLVYRMFFSCFKWACGILRRRSWRSFSSRLFKTVYYECGLTDYLGFDHLAEAVSARFSRCQVTRPPLYSAWRKQITSCSPRPRGCQELNSDLLRGGYPGIFDSLNCNQSSLHKNMPCHIISVVPLFAEG